MSHSRITWSRHLSRRQPCGGLPFGSCAVALVVTACSLVLAGAVFASGRAGFVKGADLSFLEQVEDAGGVFTEKGEPRDLLELLIENGFDFVRLRLWVDPADGYCDLESTLRMAARACSLGLGLLIDLHYSDTWADPGRQTMPARWRGAEDEALADSVRAYTALMVKALRDHGALPDMVQIGNEVVCGMLWDRGRVCGEFDTPAQWDEFARFLRAGVEGVHEALPGADTVKVVIHIDRGADNAGARRFLDRLLERSVEFDLIGLSYYPWWHGSLEDLRANLSDLSLRYGKGVLIVETAYPWTLGWHDDTHNIVGLPGHTLPGYPPSVEGQERYLRDLIRTVRDVPGGLGLGVFYWAPEWISAPASGSAWENVTLFDFSGEVLSSIRAFQD